jgi:hypothetical protein
LPLTYGGTGADFSEIPSCAIIRASSNLNSYPSLSYTPTKKGAVYVETNSGELNFGTLDIEYGGTGETSKPTYQVLSDNYYDKASIVSNATIKFKYIPYLNLTYINMQFTIEPT